MSFESAFYSKYSHLTNHTTRELLQTLLSLHNYSKTIDEIHASIETILIGNDVKEILDKISLIQNDFLMKREKLCIANEQVCQHIRMHKEYIDRIWSRNTALTNVLASTLDCVKKKKYHYEQIIEEHKIILDKQDKRLTSTINQINVIKVRLQA